MACDICGKKGTPLIDLLSSYQTENIKAICSVCESVVNGKNSKLLTLTMKIKQTLFKSWMTNLKEGYKY